MASSRSPVHHDQFTIKDASCPQASNPRGTATGHDQIPRGLMGRPGQQQGMISLDDLRVSYASCPATIESMWDQWRTKQQVSISQVNARTRDSHSDSHPLAKLGTTVRTDEEITTARRAKSTDVAALELASASAANRLSTHRQPDARVSINSSPANVFLPSSPYPKHRGQRSLHDQV